MISPSTGPRRSTPETDRSVMMAERKLMTVEGYIVPAEIEDRVLARIRADAPFRAAEVVAWLTEAGVPPNPRGYSVAYRIADRMLQRERKAGNISFGPDGRWHQDRPVASLAPTEA